jgi:hypothetical protein
VYYAGFLVLKVFAGRWFENSFKKHTYTIGNMGKKVKISNDTHIRLQQAKAEYNKQNPEHSLTFDDTINELLDEADL